MDSEIKITIAHCQAAKQWDRIGIAHHHGIALPLFSIHSAKSCGIGEYLDLLPLIDWCHEIGLDVIQLLPINDTGLGTSPYDAVSAFALNPIHLSLNGLPHLDKYPDGDEKLKELSQPSSSTHIHYESVREKKYEFLKSYYAAIAPSILETVEYKNFIQASPWIKKYALFKVLKEHYQWLSWEEWPEELRSPAPEQVDALIDQYRESIEWHCFIQFLCDKQMQQVYQHANEKNVFLMGDIPILINRDSADVWLNRDFFHMHYSAGAPPDVFSPEGQEWGFPIYNWESLAQTGYQWWIDRLKLAGRYYHIYRIDHIVGFFRIWAISLGDKGKQGFFLPSDPSTWIDHGCAIMKIMLDNCDMLPIGEDLGDVRPSIKKELNRLGICGTKVVRWERNWDVDKQFIPMDAYPVISMTTVSTHDSETLQLWWQNNVEEAQDFAQFKGWGYHHVLSREHHEEMLWDTHHSNSLFTINLLQEYLSLIPGLSWPKLEDERINVPGTISDRNWSNRYKSSIEEITTNQTLTHLLKEIII